MTPPARRCGLAVVLAFIAALGPTISARAETIKIASTRSLSNAPFLIAQAKGYFAAEGIAAELIFIDSAGPITAAVVSGDVDFGATGLSAAFYNLAGQGILRIIAGHIYDFPGFRSTAVVVSNHAWDAGLRSFSDLPGHSIAVTQIGTPLHYSIGLLAQKYGFEMSRLRILALQSFPNTVAAATGGSADAAVVSVNYVLPALERGDVQLLGYIGDETPAQIGAVFAATRTADEGHDMVARFLTAFRRATRDYHDAFTGPDGKLAFEPSAPGILAIIAKGTQLPMAQIEQGLAYVDADARLDVTDILHQIAWYKSQGMVRGEIDGDSVIDKRYVIPLPPR